ncbi:uncharacterized protein LOC128244839 isoform X2 [Mya arenaria]|nr:uncharacterized protein LOC128244839 isoform X2 [Mya arenaria]
MDHLRLLNYSMSVDEAAVSATVRTSGFHYSDFCSKNGLPKPWQMMKLLESCRFFSHHWPLDDTGRTFRDYAEVTSDRLTFLVTSSLDIEKDLYDPAKPKCPLDVVVQGGYIGSTSLNSIATVRTLDGVDLIKNVNQVVSVDKSSRRPLRLPEWWKEKYEESAKKFSALKFDRYAKPATLPSFKVHVTRSDQDGNNHTNWSCYVRFGLDGLYHNVKHGLVQHFNDLEKRGLKRMELLFSGESFDDDILDVYVWNDPDDVNKVRVHVEKEGVFLFQGMFEYFADPLY